MRPSSDKLRVTIIIPAIEELENRAIWRFSWKEIDVFVATPPV